MRLSAAHLARWGAALAIGIGALTLAACSEPASAPEFSYTVLDGSRHNSSALRGKVVLVNFWATTCTTCVKEMPQFVTLHKKFKSAGFETLAVAMHYDAPAAVADYAETRGLLFPVVIDNTGAIARGFGDVPGTPTTFVVDQRGRIVERIVGEPDFVALSSLIERLLKAG